MYVVLHIFDIRVTPRSGTRHVAAYAGRFVHRETGGAERKF
jgi:hypothetical protein